jgi:hypothetical protein
MSVDDLNAKASQRKSQRFKVSWASRVLMPDRRIIAARTKDVSAGGVGFELSEQLPVGSDISMELSPWVGGKQYSIRAKCVVTYSMILAGSVGFSHGVRFSMIPDDQLASLKKVIKSLE